MTLPFTVQNTNKLLDIINLSLSCMVHHVKYVPSEDEFSGSTVSVTGSRTLIHGDQLSYFCSLPRGIVYSPANRIVSATIRVQGTYDTQLLFGYVRRDRKFVSHPFFWKEGFAGNQWMEGEPTY